MQNNNNCKINSRHHPINATMWQSTITNLPHRSSSSPPRCRDGRAKVSVHHTLFCYISPVPGVAEYKWGGYRSFVHSPRLYIRRTCGTLSQRYGPDRTWGWEMACPSSPAPLTDGRLLTAPDQGELWVTRVRSGSVTEDGLGDSSICRERLQHFTSLAESNGIS